VNGQEFDAARMAALAASLARPLYQRTTLYQRVAAPAARARPATAALPLSTP
jgi:hypothetical protein